MKFLDSASDNLQKRIKELSGLNYKAVTILERCKSCGTCVRFCPLNIRAFGDHGKAITISSNRSCGGCSVCFHRCPNKAINLMIIKAD
jgi:2-oxoglutarate ferredoxin oxidoreductase subunit delta